MIYFITDLQGLIHKCWQLLVVLQIGDNTKILRFDGFLRKYIPYTFNRLSSIFRIAPVCEKKTCCLDLRINPRIRVQFAPHFIYRLEFFICKKSLLIYVFVNEIYCIQLSSKILEMHKLNNLSVVLSWSNETLANVLCLWYYSYFSVKYVCACISFLRNYWN